MTDPEKSSHWDSLAKDIGADVSKSQSERPAEPKPEVVIPRRRSSRPAAPKPAVSDWDALAAELGAAPAETTPAKPASIEEPVARDIPTETPAASGPTAALPSAEPLAIEPVDAFVLPSGSESGQLPGFAPDVPVEAEPVVSESGDAEAADEAVEAAFAEDAESAESSTERKRSRRRPRRRRRGGRSSDKSSESTNENADAAELDVVTSDESADGADDLTAAVDAQTGESPDGESADESTGDVRRRRRRRRRKKPARASGEESRPDRDVDDEGDIVASLDNSEDRDARPSRDADAITSPRDDGSRSSRPSHKNIPTWQESVGVIIDANIEARNAQPKQLGSASSRGGRGRGRGGRGRGRKKTS